MTVRVRAWQPAAAVAAGLLPLARLVLDGATAHLGADPVAAVLNRLGFWTLTLLLVALVPTPLRELTGWSWPVRVRRALGLTAFAYAALHLVVYLAIDQGLDLGAIGKDVAKHRFVLAGMCAFLLLVPLAATSTARAVRRLGFARWKRLHRLAYLAPVLGVVHFWWRVKADHRQPALFAAALAVLLAARVPGWLREARAARAPRPVRA